MPRRKQQRGGNHKRNGKPKRGQSPVQIELTRDSILEAFRDLELYVWWSSRVPKYLRGTVVQLIRAKCNARLMLAGYDPAYTIRPEEIIQ